jgi:hypothetical protein
MVARLPLPPHPALPLIHPHHHLLLQLLADTSTTPPSETHLPISWEYPFPCALLVDPPPIWMSIPLTPCGCKSGEALPENRQEMPTAVPSQGSRQQSAPFQPVDPTHQYLRNLTEALSKHTMPEIPKTRPTPVTSSSSGDTFHQRNAQFGPTSTTIEGTPLPHPPHPYRCPWNNRRHQQVTQGRQK